MSISINTAVFIAESETHVAADKLVQGTYFDAVTDKGCFIGCHAKGSNPKVLEQRFGMPVPLVWLCEDVFEALPAAKAQAFYLAIPASIAVDGKDLSRIVWHFLAAELRALPPQSEAVQVAIDRVIAGMDLLAAGLPWAEAAAAAEAEAARDRQAATILRLLTEAPMAGDAQ